MLFDILLRLCASIVLILCINASGITTFTVVMSICIFLCFGVGQLLSGGWGNLVVSNIAFLLALVVILTTGDHGLWQVALLVFFCCFYNISMHLYEQMCTYQRQLHRMRDDSKELEYTLKNKNQRLLQEQDQQVRLATLAERNRIAREIHDNVGHLLSRAILLLGAILTVNRDESMAPQLQMLSDTLDESMAKMRASVHDLHDDSIDLAKNFEEILQQLSAFRLTTELDLDEALPTDVKLTLIGILKEATTNILKHSNGDAVSVFVHNNYSFLTLSVTDNGTLTPEEKARISSETFEGIGLHNIRNRAKSVGGDVYFYMNDGFTVFARIPVPTKDATAIVQDR